MRGEDDLDVALGAERTTFEERLAEEDAAAIHVWRASTLSSAFVTPSRPSQKFSLKTCSVSAQPGP
jgi:hypothetical protein